ncbi:DUF3718 domain-containing protein [Pseudoalteromonas sp. CO302Y]|uniref:DUF3718 domain-containing protein n=1 Tax=unclassified Pseudoalteromonas TaxID=194690 RepID=UPI0010232DC5|nr:DUF3718 domain-containing protein [Pseudoalteromonas sp. CO302Y]RZG10922.1 DUF3718 domain-containing protein [Pseudoalteromonas sp. CO133X]
MNTLTTTLGTALIIGSSVITFDTNAAQFVAADDSPGTQTCMAIASNNRLDLVHKMRDLGINRRVISDKLLCNNMSTAKFASIYGFNKTAKYLKLESTQTSIHDLAKTADDTVIVIAGSK